MGTWDRLIPLLPQHIGILCIDFPGHGQSSRFPKGMSYHVVMDYVHIVQRIIKEYNWKKVSLMGHSMGSLICYVYTSIYPHTVDMVIAIDIIKPVYRSENIEILRFGRNIEKSLIEDDRLDALALHEPPAYTYEQLEKILFEGSFESVDLENCKYLLYRSITKSTKYPDKYYFSRDGKSKFYYEFNPAPGLVEEMAKRIHNVAYFVAKGSESHYINEDSNPVIDTLRKQNPHFELHTVTGTHHLHLNNAEELAMVLNPFIHHHRPATLNTWSIEEEADEKEQEATSAPNGYSKKGLWNIKPFAKRKNNVKSKL